MGCLKEMWFGFCACVVFAVIVLFVSSFSTYAVAEANEQIKRMVPGVEFAIEEAEREDRRLDLVKRRAKNVRRAAEAKAAEQRAAALPGPHEFAEIIWETELEDVFRRAARLAKSKYEVRAGYIIANAEADIQPFIDAWGEEGFLAYFKDIGLRMNALLEREFSHLPEGGPR